MVKYIKYCFFGLAIEVFIYLVVEIFSSAAYAKSIAIVVVPLALWSGRLIVAFKSGVITRRLPMLDGGEVRQGHFWSFRPDVYVRAPGFDNFKGYILKEILFCLLGWFMFLSPVFMTVVSD